MATVEQKVLPLYPGQRLSRDEFLRRWEAMPKLKFAELIGGIVYRPSPLSAEHGDTDVNVATWLGMYALSTPGCKPNAKSSWLMLADSPQPDCCLRVLPEYGGHSDQEGRYLAGAPELVVEVSVSSESYDLHEKLDLCQAAGVDEYLTVLLAAGIVRWHRLVEGAYQVIQPSADGVLRSQAFPGLWLNPHALLNGDMSAVVSVLQQGLHTPEHAEFVAALGKRKSK